MTVCLEFFSGFWVGGRGREAWERKGKETGGGEGNVQFYPMPGEVVAK